MKLAAFFGQPEGQQLSDLWCNFITAKFKSGVEEQSTFHCSSELQWKPNSPLCRRLCISDRGPQSKQTHRSLLCHDYSKYFYLCTKVNEHVLRVAANCNKTKPQICPWDRFLQGLTGYLWINPHSMRNLTGYLWINPHSVRKLLNNEVNAESWFSGLFSSWPRSLWPKERRVQILYGTGGGLWLIWAKGNGFCHSCLLRKCYGASDYRKEGIKDCVIWEWVNISLQRWTTFFRSECRKWQRKTAAKEDFAKDHFRWEKRIFYHLLIVLQSFRAKKGWPVERHSSYDRVSAFTKSY